MPRRNKVTKDVINTIKEAIDGGYIPITLGRVSTSRQRKGLPTQMETLKQYVKALGFDARKVIPIPIRQSGRDGDQKTLAAVKELVEANPKKKYVAVFRETTRIGRDTENALRLRRLMSEIGVPIIAMDLPELTGKKPMGFRGSDLLFIILSGIAETGKEAEQFAQQEGADKAASKGMVGGVPQNLYLKQYKPKSISVHRAIRDALPMIDNGTLSGRELTKLLKIPDGQRRKIQERLENMPKAKQDEYLEVIDAILEAEKQVGRRDTMPAERRTRKQKALHRVTVGYLRFPDTFPRPDTVGNPEIARLTGKEGVGTIADAIANPSLYQPAK